MRQLGVFALSLVVSVGLISCASEASVANNTAIVTSSPVVLSSSPSASTGDVDSLCARLKDLKKIPYDYDELTGDPIYDGFKSAGLKAVPCLVEKIVDTTPMKDPGPGPVVPSFKVGDAATFMLLMITEEEWQPDTMFSPEYARRWKDEGIYAYFAFVEKKENRKQFQLWWKDWMRKHKNL